MKKLFLALALLFVPSVAWAQCNGSFGASQVCGTDVSPGPPKPINLSNLPSLGIGYALGPGTLGIGGGGSGYVIGDRVTLACTGVTFTTAPVVSITSVSTGAVAGSFVLNPGLTSLPHLASCTFTQASTTGVGVGATFTGTLGPIAAQLSTANLNTGGTATNGNLFIGGEQPNSAFAGNESTFLGDKAGGGFIGAAVNTAVGHNACGVNGSSSATGNFNVCIGRNAGRNISGSANSNTLIGDDAGGNENGTPLSGSSNTFVGFEVGQNVTSGNFNVMVGVNAGNATSTQNGMVAIGNNALANSTTADNTAVGLAAGQQATSATGLALFGASAGTAITSGSSNTLIGFVAGQSLTSGGSNTAVGSGSLGTNITGGSNTAVGSSSLALATGGSNTAVGSSSGSSITTGQQNILLGVQGGMNNTNGSSNTLIGNLVAPGLNGGNNNVVIGATTSSCDVSSSGINDEVDLCTSSTPLIRISGGATPSTATTSLAGKLNVASTVAIGQLPTVSATLNVLTPSTGSPGGAPTAWTSQYAIFGPNVGSATGAAVGIGYDSTDTAGIIISLAPNTSWEPLAFQGSQYRFLVTGATWGSPSVFIQNGLNVGGASDPGSGNIEATSQFLVGSTDTGISRDSAAVIDFGNGTATNSSATLQMSSFVLSGTPKFVNFTTGAGTQTFTNSPCSALTTERWIKVTFSGSTSQFFIPACS